MKPYFNRQNQVTYVLGGFNGVIKFVNIQELKGLDNIAQYSNMFHMLQTSNDMGHKSSVYSMAVLNDNQGIFATGSGDKSIKVWDFRT